MVADGIGPPKINQSHILVIFVLRRTFSISLSRPLLVPLAGTDDCRSSLPRPESEPPLRLGVLPVLTLAFPHI